MQTTSAFKQLKQRKITCEVAQQLLVSPQGFINFKLLDSDVSDIFFRRFPDRKFLPPVVPLLLWGNCYYLGSPTSIKKEDIKKLSDRLGTSIQIVPIDENSYRKWLRLQNLNLSRVHSSLLGADLKACKPNLGFGSKSASILRPLERGRLIVNQICGDVTVNSLSGEIEQEDIAQTTELYLSQTDNQIERIRTIISGALRNRASDIHLEPTTAGLRVRYRIDGILRHITTLPPEISRKVIVSLKVMCDMDISESRRPQDGRIGEKYVTNQQQELGLDLRVSTLPCVSSRKGEPGEKAVLRLLRQQNSFSTIEDLGFSEQTRVIYQSWLEQPQGMVILTGPTGSGKTSTLYTSLQALAKDTVNVVTVEDPVEHVLPDITQTQVNEAAGMTFAAGLRAILRQDPGIIILGEIRDHETPKTAARAALARHLVLTTLHTNNAIEAIPRLKDIGPDLGLISDALLGVVAQRLVRRVCPHWAEPYTSTASNLKKLGLKLEEANPKGWPQGRGYSPCFNSGYLGREAIVKVLSIGDTVRQIIDEYSTFELQRYLMRCYSKAKNSSVKFFRQRSNLIECN